jgi:hypothetical protein
MIRFQLAKSPFDGESKLLRQARYAVVRRGPIQCLTRLSKLFGRLSRFRLSTLAFSQVLKKDQRIIPHEFSYIE